MDAKLKKEVIYVVC